jgi:hypothetical protein
MPDADPDVDVDVEMDIEIEIEAEPVLAPIVDARPRRRRPIAWFAATGALAIGLPVGAASWVGARTDALADHLGAVSGVHARIGGVDADLTGTIRLTDVALGELAAADELEASVALDSLLAGELGADEVRVSHPRVALKIDADGDSDLARLARRVMEHVGGSRAPGAARGKLRRIVVSSGRLTAQLAGVGEVSAEDVELLPDAAGIRVLTGAVHVSGAGGPVTASIDLARSAAELALPKMRVGRALAVAGNGTITVGDRQVAVHDVAIGRLAPNGPLELRGAIDDGGIPRPVSASLLAGADPTVSLHGERVPLDPFAALMPKGLELAEAHVSGDLSVQRTARTLHVVIDGRIEGAQIDHRAIAAGPVALDGAMRGSIDVAADAITIPSLSITTGAVHATLAGFARRSSPMTAQLDLGIAEAPCASLLASLPLELRGPLDGLALAGTVGATGHLAIDLAAADGSGVQLTAGMTGGCDVLAEPPAADASVLRNATEQNFPDGTRAKVGKGQPGWVELRQLPRWVGGAFVAAEDAAFWDHHGFDLNQIARSLEIDLREHKLVRGGSTISQQLIKNAFLSQRRSLDRKLQEAILTWRLEARLDKTAILERYLNIIELGPSVYGIGAAAAHWFGESPRELSVKQSAFLAALTSEPQSATHRIRKAGGLDPDTAARVEVVLYAMHRDNLIDDAQLDDARNTALTFIPAAVK